MKTATVVVAAVTSILVAFDVSLLIGFAMSGHVRSAMLTGGILACWVSFSYALGYTVSK